MANNEHGGAREGAGRKPKATELEIVSKLSELDEAWMSAMKNGINNGEFNFCKLFADYRYGKPKERVDHTTNGKDIGAIIQIVRPSDA